MEFIEGENYFAIQDTYTEEEKEEISFQLGQNVKQMVSIKGTEFGQLGDEVNQFKTQYELVRHMLSNVINDADRKSVEYFIRGKELLHILQQDKEIFAEVEQSSMVHYDLWEGRYREYEDDWQYRWVAPLYEASLKELQ